jgi:hypothetical protein
MPRTTSRDEISTGDFKPITGEGPKGLWTPKQTQLITGNYVRAYANAPDVHREHGAEFFPSWNEDAHHIGEAIGQGHEAGAALLAHLSPANEAEMNRIQGLQLVHGVSGKQAGHMVKAGAAASRGVGATSRRTAALRKGDTSGASHWHAEAESAKAEAQHHRAKSGLKGTPLGYIGSREFANAWSIRTGNYEGHPLDTLGDLKLGDFGRTIADPSHPQVTVDTHYHDAGVNRTDIPYTTSRGLGAKGRVAHFQGASEAARQQIMSQTGVHIEPSAFMGGIWYAHQQRKVMENPDARKARKASNTKLENVRQSHMGSQFLPENYGLRPSFGKIDV